MCLSRAPSAQGKGISGAFQWPPRATGTLSFAPLQKQVSFQVSVMEDLFSRRSCLKGWTQQRDKSPEGPVLKLL